MSLTSFLSASTSYDKRCVLCNLIIANNDRIAKITSEEFASLREQATKWASINTICCSEPPYSEFQKVLGRISTTFNENYIVHKRCRITFRTRLARKEAMNQNLLTEDIGNCDLKSEPSTSDGFTQRNRRESNKKKMICFV